MITGSNGGSLHDRISATDLDKPAPPPLPPMRLFVVHRFVLEHAMDPDTIEQGTYDIMLHAHSFAPDTAGIVHFYEYAAEWIQDRWEIVSYCRRSLKVWDDVEEVRQTEGGVN